ncbi:hypothetical protein HGM15179_014568 [Zosterops borbonicus]|uniref:Uncharacterized protein n=1 Tax=Zosterops borbonicus TaxID=364589 RepID=A0A8K1G6T6_9PASS|nr:hypothetical protein HGM15179_014568 [Zosterops borbonicus]
MIWMRISSALQTTPYWAGLLTGLDQQSEGSSPRFNKAKCRVMHLGHSNPCSDTGWRKSGWQSLAEKDLGMLVFSQLNMSQCVPMQHIRPMTFWLASENSGVCPEKGNKADDMSRE